MAGNEDRLRPTFPFSFSSLFVGFVAKEVVVFDRVFPCTSVAKIQAASRHRAGRTLRFCPVVALRGDLPDNPASITDARAGRTLLDTGQRRDARAAVS
ncbi:hypothetical protein [Vogesella sp. EB]|uniref:hypothetical protein n=1 Tax=Vogesella sp. EB TaxID=1526735 RepID=UPI0012E054D6|nr:hypothetical protein [Vogesella sp. EB]